MNAPELSVLFLTYNRADLLAITVESVRRALNRLSGLTYELVVSDDASDAENRAAIGHIGVDKILWSERNAGLSGNHNKGLRGCRGQFILSLQDDWEFVGEPSVISKAIDILKRDGDVGSVNLMPPTTDLPHELRRLAENEYIVFVNDGARRRRPGSARPYTDRPHLKRVQFVQSMGDYREELPMTLAELEFQQRVACQDRWKIAFIRGPVPFSHLGGDRTFNPGHHRARRLNAIFSLPVIGPVYKRVRTVARRCRDQVLGVR